MQNNCKCVIAVYSLHIIRTTFMYRQENCKTCVETPSFHLTEDRDEQNDAINGRLEKIKAQLVLFDAPCETYSDITINENPLMFGLCNTLRNKLQQFTKSIAQYVSSVI